MDFKKAFIGIGATIYDAIVCLNSNSLKICLVIDTDNSFIGTVSDGDIRRSLLRGETLSTTIAKIVNTHSVVVPPNVSKELVKSLMIVNKIHQIPVLSSENHVVDIHLWDELDVVSSKKNLFIIMAGGLGARLRPHTIDCPKPMLKVSGKPILHHIIDRAKLQGFSNFKLVVNYKSDLIESYFGFGNNLNCSISYIKETDFLGTAGGLSLLDPVPSEPFIVTNGDIVTDIDYGRMLDFHIQHRASGTMAIRLHEWQNPFGVVETDGLRIVGFEEKPVHRSFINAGVYVLNPVALGLIGRGQYFDMPMLFENLKESNQILAYPMHESWLDIGRPEDLVFANKSINK